MVAVHVLGDDRDRRGVFQLGQGAMGGVGLGGGDEASAPVVPAPDQFGITGESPRGGQFLGSVPAPQAVLFTPEGGDAAGRGNSGSGQHGDPGFRGEPFLDPVEFRADVCIHDFDHPVHRSIAGCPF
jgi:hypothetical protein